MLFGAMMFRPTENQLQLNAWAAFALVEITAAAIRDGENSLELDGFFPFGFGTSFRLSTAARRFGNACPTRSTSGPEQDCAQILEAVDGNRPEALENAGGPAGPPLCQPTAKLPSAKAPVLLFTPEQESEETCFSCPAGRMRSASVWRAGKR